MAWTMALRRPAPPTACSALSSLFQRGTPVVQPSTRRQQIHTSSVVCGRRSAKIATRKGKTDGARAKLYGKFGKLIVQAVRSGGPGSDNARLRDLLAQARSSNIPKDIIERNIRNGSSPNQADYVEITYEGYGPGGTGFVIECLTDNLNRSAAEVRTALTKGGVGKVAESGSVLFSFRRQGLVRVGPSHTEDEARVCSPQMLSLLCDQVASAWTLFVPQYVVQVFEAATDAGAEDVAVAEPDEDGAATGFKVFTQPTDFMQVYAALEGAGLEVLGDESALVYLPQSPVEVDGEIAEQNEMLLDRLLAVDDVDAVYSSFV